MHEHSHTLHIDLLVWFGAPLYLEKNPKFPYKSSKIRSLTLSLREYSEECFDKVLESRLLDLPNLQDLYLVYKNNSPFLTEDDRRRIGRAKERKPRLITLVLDGAKSWYLKEQSLIKQLSAQTFERLTLERCSSFRLWLSLFSPHLKTLEMIHPHQSWEVKFGKSFQCNDLQLALTFLLQPRRTESSKYWWSYLRGNSIC